MPTKYQATSLVLSVHARNRLILLKRTSNKAKTVLVASRVLDGAQPDRVAAAQSIGARLEANLLVGLVLEDKVAVGVEREAGALAVAASALNAGGVLEDALSHAGSVDKCLLRGVGSVEVELAGVAQLEGSVVDFLRARSVLGWGVDVEAAAGSLNGSVL